MQNTSEVNRIIVIIAPANTFPKHTVPNRAYYTAQHIPHTGKPATHDTHTHLVLNMTSPTFRVQTVHSKQQTNNQVYIE